MSAIARPVAACAPRLAVVIVIAIATLLAGGLADATARAAQPTASAAGSPNGKRSGNWKRRSHSRHASKAYRAVRPKRRSHSRHASKAYAAARRKRATAPALAFGLNGGGLFARPAGEWAPVLGRLKAAGLTSVRQDLSWSGVEPTAGSFDWTRSDRIAAALAAAGLRWHPVLGYSTDWSGVTPGDQMSHPADPARFAAYAAAVAARYGAGGLFWAEHPELQAVPMTSYEVWNEPNAARFWREQATAPADYADLYAATRSAIRAVDPAATVVVGGLVERGARGFVQRFYAHRPDLRGHVDAIGFHAYNATSGAMLRAVAGFRATVDRLDPGVPLAVTEAGFSTTSMSDATRGTELARLASGLAARKALRVSSLLPYAAMTSESAPGSWEQWFGIFNLDGTPKRSATTFLAAVGAAVR